MLLLKYLKLKTVALEICSSILRGTQDKKLWLHFIIFFQEEQTEVYHMTDDW